LGEQEISMPTTAQEILAGVETQVLDGIRRGQDAVVRVIRTAAEAGKPISPALRPIGQRLPNAAKLVDHGFALADRVLTNQRDFALSLLKAVEPVLGNGRSKPAAAPAAATPARPRASAAKPAAATA
jgi:hypothetical protein